VRPIDPANSVSPAINFLLIFTQERNLPYATSAFNGFDLIIVLGPSIVSAVLNSSSQFSPVSI
jgi:hypothetical protein